MPGSQDNQHPKGSFANALSLVALAGDIWACVVYVYPFVKAQKGINNDGAIALTVLIGATGGTLAVAVGRFIGNGIDQILGSTGEPNNAQAVEQHTHHHYHAGVNLKIFDGHKSKRGNKHNLHSHDEELGTVVEFN
jgi:hypothetical protein